MIISSYNDKDIIRPYFAAIIQALKGQSRYRWEIIFVDDGSTDGSVEVLQDLVQKNSGVYFVQLARNFGQQKAFFSGMKVSQGDVIVTVDGDFQYPPECFFDLIDKVVEGYDVVSGIRVDRKDTWSSRSLSRIGQYFIRRALRNTITDFGAIKAFSRFLVDKIMSYENYCILPYGMAYALTNRVIEVRVKHLPRPVGQSKWSFTKRVHMYLDLFLAYSPYEATSVLMLGIYMMCLGLLSLLILFYLYLAHDIFFFHTFTALLSLVVIISGVGLILSSFFLSFMLRIYRQLLWRGESVVLRKFYNS